MIVIRYQSFAANAVLTHRFQSVATCSSQAGDGSLLPRVMRFPSRRAPFGSIFFRDFCRPLVGWSFGALAQACKQSSRRFAVLFRPSLSVVFAHAEQHERKALKCPTKALKELTR